VQRVEQEMRPDLRLQALEPRRGKAPLELRRGDGALGATPGTLATHVWLEGLLVGLLSWLAAAILTLPLSWALETACGAIFLKAPLDFEVSARALALWLAIVLVIASIASFTPALRAARMRVTEALGWT